MGCRAARSGHLHPAFTASGHVSRRPIRTAMDGSHRSRLDRAWDRRVARGRADRPALVVDGPRRVHADAARCAAVPVPPPLRRPRAGGGALGDPGARLERGLLPHHRADGRRADRRGRSGVGRVGATGHDPLPRRSCDRTHPSPGLERGCGVPLVPRRTRCGAPAGTRLLAHDGSRRRNRRDCRRGRLVGGRGRCRRGVPGPARRRGVLRRSSSTEDAAMPPRPRHGWPSDWTTCPNPLRCRRPSPKRWPTPCAPTPSS